MNINLLRTNFQKSLFRILENQKEGEKSQPLIEEVSLEDESIEIEEKNSSKIKEKNSSPNLKKVSIHKLNFKDKKSVIKAIWRVNLELLIPGISTQGKTVEVALMILQKFETGDYTLNVCLIEMKSSLQPRKVKKKDGKDIIEPSSLKDIIEPSSLTEIKEKIVCSMNRMYMLMSLNNHQNRKAYSGVNINIAFKGIIIFNDINKLLSDDDSGLYKILISTETTKKSRLLTVHTILGDSNKIEIKFFPRENEQPPEHRILQLSDLL